MFTENDKQAVAMKKPPMIQLFGVANTVKGDGGESGWAGGESIG